MTEPMKPPTSSVPGGEREEGDRNALVMNFLMNEKFSLKHHLNQQLTHEGGRLQGIEIEFILQIEYAPIAHAAFRQEHDHVGERNEPDERIHQEVLGRVIAARPIHFLAGRLFVLYVADESNAFRVVDQAEHAERRESHTDRAGDEQTEPPAVVQNRIGDQVGRNRQRKVRTGGQDAPEDAEIFLRKPALDEFR